MPKTEEPAATQSVRIAARDVPVPVSISTQAQAVLSAAVRDDGTPFNALYPSPAPEDHEMWRQMQAAGNASYAETLKNRGGVATAQVETIAIGTATVHVATPEDMRHPDCVHVDLHGGAFVFGGGVACRESARMQADQHGMVSYGIDYRMPPDHPYPAGLDDCMAVYEHLLGTYRADRIVLNGRSAGGNLLLAMLLRARDAGLPMPAGAVLLSPEADLTESGDSFQTNRTVDVVLPNSLMSNNLLYAGGADLTDPYVSPLFGEMTSDLPPIFLQSGTRDQFLSNAVRLHRKLLRANVPTELHIFEAMPHGGFGNTPEDAELAREIARFVLECVSR